MSTTLLLNLSLSLSSIGLVGCTQVSTGKLLVAAASDLAPALPALREGARRETGVEVEFSTGSSGQLARQILHGAPMDVFLSANEEFAREVAAATLKEPVRVYAVGRLALWSREGKVKRLAELADEGVGRIAIANPSHAPYGVAAKAALEKAGLYEGLRPRLVLAESVRQTVQFAETGNVGATITAWTLVRDRGGGLLSEEVAPGLRQGAVLVRDTAGGRKFLEFLLSSGGQEILRNNGLFPAGGN